MIQLVSPLVLTVHGRARPQGSMEARPNGTMAYSASTLRWRQTVTEGALRQLSGRAGPRGPVIVWEPLCVPVVAAVEFVFEGDPCGKARPDLDKCVRAVGDSLTDAQVWEDDRWCVGWLASKRTCRPGELEHVSIRLEW